MGADEAPEGPAWAGIFVQMPTADRACTRLSNSAISVRDSDPVSSLLCPSFLDPMKVLADLKKRDGIRVGVGNLAGSSSYPALVSLGILHRDPPSWGQTLASNP